MAFLTDRDAIIEWLEKYDQIMMRDIIFNEDMTVSITTSVDLEKKNLTCLPIKFRDVDRIYLDNNPLTTLEGCPETVYGKFSVDKTKITSLKYMPKIIMDGFDVVCAEITPEGYTPALLSQIKGSIRTRHPKLDVILMEGRDTNGKLPRELVPEKINQIRELFSQPTFQQTQYRHMCLDPTY
jgi:hypothetical protein